MVGSRQLVDLESDFCQTVCIAIVLVQFMGDACRFMSEYVKHKVEVIVKFGKRRLDIHVGDWKQRRCNVLLL